MANLGQQWSFEPLAPVFTLASRLQIEYPSVTASSQDALEEADYEITTPQARALGQTTSQKSLKDDPSVSRCAFLLEMAQHSGSTTITLTPNLLASLLASVDRLRNENISLKSEKIPPTSAGGPKSLSGLGFNLTAFNLFPKLPLELRRKVWRVALFTPQVLSLHHVLHYDRLDDTDDLKFIPSAPRSLIRHVCQEARVEANIVQSPLRNVLYVWEDDKDTEFDNFFFNYEVDTIWLSSEGITGDDAQSRTFGLDQYLHFDKKYVRLAIDQGFWHRMFHTFGDTLHHEEQLLSLYKLGVEEVMVVVETSAAIRHSGKVTFTKARGLPVDFDLNPIDKYDFGASDTWESIANQQIQTLSDFQADARAELRQEMIDDGLDPDDPENKDDNEGNVLNYTLKKITYVEAVTFEELEKIKEIRRRITAWFETQGQ